MSNQNGGEFCHFEVKNCYSEWGKKLPLLKNVNEVYQLVHPSIILVSAMSGGGKTNLVPSIIAQMGGFDRILLFTGTSTNELVYNRIKENAPENFEAYEGFSSFMKVIKEIKNDEDLQHERILCIVDDFLGIPKKCMQEIDSFSTWSRKTTDQNIGGGLTYMLLTQSFFDVPTLLRKNVKYFIIGRGFDKREISSICGRFSSADLTIDQIYHMYKQSTKDMDITDFFTIDKLTCQPNLKFRRQFDDAFVIDPSSPWRPHDIFNDENRRRQK